MELNAEQTELWNVALVDAEEPQDIELVLTSTMPDEPWALGCWYFPPGANLITDPPAELTPDERQQLMATREHPRITIYSGSRPREFLADARWTLELDRQRRTNAYLPIFGALVNRSVDTNVSGPGSAVVWHCLPHIKDADLAAAYLIERRLGPQTGDFFGPYGVMLRTDRPAPDPTTLPRRLVVAGAMFAEDLANSLVASDSVADHLDELHPDARKWWDRLVGNEDFEHLRKSQRFYRPSESDIEAVHETRGQASRWRGWETHFYITLDHGLSLLD